MRATPVATPPTWLKTVSVSLAPNETSTTPNANSPSFSSLVPAFLSFPPSSGPSPERLCYNCKVSVSSLLDTPKPSHPRAPSLVARTGTHFSFLFCPLFHFPPRRNQDTSRTNARSPVLQKTSNVTAVEERVRESLPSL